ncbi:DNA mismatch repair protein MutL, partial [Alkalihalophilus lindianensis]|nr:DNA mismatch repair protein MutL [Alkalihalophilus lindianensis]
RGTDITITDLFYNTPARLKYMKTIHTELGNITDVVNRLALAHPEVAFRLIHNERKLLQTSGSGDVRQVLAAIYGMSI